jgi:ABC-2 type transport system permease protein
VHRGYGLVLSSVGQRLQTFWEMSRKTIVEFSRYPVAFAALFAQIFLIILMFLLAALTFADPSKASEGLGRQLAGVMIYGFVTNMFLSFVLWEIGFSIREEQARGTLESLYLSPASKFGALVSRIFAISIFTGLFCAAGVLMVNFLVGGLAFHNGGLAMVVLLLAFSGFLGIGFVFAGLSIKLKESAQFLVNGTQFFFMIFSAQFFPFAALASIHPGLLAVSRALPVSYAVDLFRSLLLGVEPELLDAPTEFLIVVAFAILSPLLGFFAYKYVERRARKDGNLGEF